MLSCSATYQDRATSGNQPLFSILTILALTAAQTKQDLQDSLLMCCCHMLQTTELAELLH